MSTPTLSYAMQVSTLTADLEYALARQAAAAEYAGPAAELYYQVTSARVASFESRIASLVARENLPGAPENTPSSPVARR